MEVVNIENEKTMLANAQHPRPQCRGFSKIRKLIIRQLMVIGSPQLAAFSAGGVLVYPTVLMQQFKNDPSMHLNLATLSWLGSIHGLAGIPSILMPTLMQWKGRRLSFIATCLVVSIGWFIAYLSTNVTTVLVSEAFHGLGTNSLLAISQLSISEMIAPKYRNVSLQLFGIFQAIGSVMTGVMARYLHWKTVGLVMCLPIVIAMFIGCAWPESPAWLASKGEFDKCEHAFSWLRGMDDDSRKELREIIATQEKNLLEMKNSRSLSLGKIWETATSRDFYIPSFHIFVVLNLMYWSGNMVIIIYCIDIISRTTTNEIASYASIIINAILIVGFGVGCIFLRLYKSKTVLLTSTFFASVFLSAACLISYLQVTDVIAKDSLLFLYFLMAFMLASSLGQIPIVFGISAELMPVKHRGIGGALLVIFTCILHSTSLKAAPYLFLYLEIYGTFMIYVTNSILCGLIIWKYVPETKHRTLHDIEHYYKTGRFIKKENSDELVTQSSKLLK